MQKPTPLNGKSFRVTTNLESALRHLRLDVDRIIWIDAICIDQNDNDERASQVGLMGWVYQSSMQTII